MVHRDVWNWVRDVPCGRVVTYEQVAAALGVPDDVELVRDAVNLAREKQTDVPWWSVVSDWGGGTAYPLRDPIEEAQQVSLLSREGVQFFRGRMGERMIDLNRYGWAP